MQTHIRPLASSMFAPGVPEVMNEFHSSNEQLASFVVSVYVLGYVFGPIAVAPLSEIFGRVPLYHICNIGFVVVTVACAVASNLNMLIGFRFLEGLLGSCPLTLGGGSIADMFVQEERGGYMAIWALGPLVGPAVGPVAGGFLAQAEGWRWVFWVIAIAVSLRPLIVLRMGAGDACSLRSWQSGLVSVLGFVILRESYPVIILQRKTKRLQRATGNPNLLSKLALPYTTPQLFKTSIVRPIKMLLFAPIVLFLVCS